MLDPSPRIYPRVAWQVLPPLSPTPFLSLSHSLISVGFSPPWLLMQIQAFLFKELSTHNPMDGSIFAGPHTHTHTHRKTYSGIYHTLCSEYKDVISHSTYSHTCAHMHAHMNTNRESHPLQHGCYIFSALSCSWAITTSKPAGCCQQPCGSQLDKHWPNLNLPLMCQCKYLYFCSLQRRREEVKTRVKR